MNRLFHFAIHGPPLNFFTKMLIANCVFRLSHNVDTHVYLAQPETLGQIMDFYDRYGWAYVPCQLIR